MNPAKLQTLLNSAIEHHRADRLVEAEALYRQLRALRPGDFDVLHLSGFLAYQQERLPEAIDLLTRAWRLNPAVPVCEMRLGLALLAVGRSADAESCLRHVVAQHPDYVEGWNNLANLLKMQDRLLDALVAHEKSVALQPQNPRSWYNYGLTLSQLGRYEEALRCHERARAADPHYPIARYGLAQAYHQLNLIPEAVEHYRAFLAAMPGHLEARSYMLYALHNLPGMSHEALWEEHLVYGRIAGAESTRAWPNRPEVDRRLRVGLVSSDFRIHSCAYFIEPLLRGLDREQFELYLYYDHFREDAQTERFRSLATVWRKIVGQPAASVEALVRVDAPDLMIDLAGHTGMANRLPLFARRLAPVQLTYLGYPDTTGVTAMDYRFTDAVADPVGEADRFATERLVRFAPTAWAYQPPESAPAPIKRPASAEDAIVFGSFNTPAKLADEILALWGQILAAVPGSRLLLKGAGFGAPAVRARYQARLQRLGLPIGRVDLVDRTPDTTSHLALYQYVDIALDAHPYHGTTTTCEALWMGVPVVTLAGDQHMSRVGVSLLTAIGRPEWVASNAADYRRIAEALAADRSRLAEIRRGLRDELRRSPLLDHAGQAARFGAALRECWAEWCRRAGPPA